MRSDPLTLVLGSGPGTTASRASLLLIGPPQGSPLTFLGLEPTELGMALFVASSNPAYGGSVESAASSALGIIGDLGLVGLVAWGRYSSLSGGEQDDRIVGWPQPHAQAYSWSPPSGS